MTRTTTTTRFAANGCCGMLVLVDNAFHCLDTKTKTIEAKQRIQKMVYTQMPDLLPIKQ